MAEIPLNLVECLPCYQRSKGRMWRAAFSTIQGRVVWHGPWRANDGEDNVPWLAFGDMMRKKCSIYG